MTKLSQIKYSAIANCVPDAIENKRTGKNIFLFSSIVWGIRADKSKGYIPCNVARIGSIDSRRFTEGLKVNGEKK